MLHRDSLPAFYDAVVKACFGRGMLQEEHRTVRVREGGRGSEQPASTQETEAWTARGLMLT